MSELRPRSVTCEDCTGEAIDDLLEPARARLIGRQEPPYSLRYLADSGRGIVSVVAAHDPAAKRAALARRALRRANSRFLIALDDRSLPVRISLARQKPRAELAQAEYGWDRHLLRSFLAHDDVLAVSAASAADLSLAPEGDVIRSREVGGLFGADRAPGEIFFPRHAALGAPLVYHTGVLKPLPSWQDAFTLDSTSSAEVRCGPPRTTRAEASEAVPRRRSATPDGVRPLESRPVTSIVEGDGHPCANALDQPRSTHPPAPAC
jgi:hypothetical protein